MKAEDLRTKTKDELQKDLLDLKKQQFNLRFQLSQGQLESTAQIRTTRRNIARVMTFMNASDDAAPAKKTVKKEPKAKKPAAKTKKKTATKKTDAA